MCLVSMLLENTYGWSKFQSDELQNTNQQVQGENEDHDPQKQVNMERRRDTCCFNSITYFGFL